MSHARMVSFPCLSFELSPLKELGGKLVRLITLIPFEIFC